jgi:hypothetical protein
MMEECRSSMLGQWPLVFQLASPGLCLSGMHAYQIVLPILRIT